MYKKSQEDEYWARTGEFQSTVLDYFDVLNELDDNGEIHQWLQKAAESQEFLVCGPQE